MGGFWSPGLGGIGCKQHPACSRPASPTGPNPASCVSSQSRLVWSSREHLRAQLLNLLETTPPESSDSRNRALWLLGIVGGAPLPLLRSMILDRGTYPDLQSMALTVGAQQGLWLSGAELARLHEEHVRAIGTGLSLEVALRYARLDAFTTPLKDMLLRLSPHDRARLLCTFPFIQVPQPRAYVDWLFAHWYEVDRPLIDAEGDQGHDFNFDVAFSQRERPEAWALLMTWSQDLSAEALERKVMRNAWGWEMSRDELSRFVGANPALRHGAAEGLMLPLEELRAHFGDDRLLRRLDSVVRMERAAGLAPYGILAHPPAFDWALPVLGQWNEARRRVLPRWLCDFELEENARRSLLEQLCDHDPAMAMRWARVAMRYPGNTSLIVSVLRLALDSRAPDARPLFLDALEGPDAEARPLAIAGLVMLGEASAAWTDRLLSLTNDAHPEVRLHALAGLVQQGQRQWLEVLRPLAREAAAPGVRAQALRWLGVLDGEASRPLFMDVLAQAPSRGDEDLYPCCSTPFLSPELREAVVALSQLGTDEDLSALLELVQRGYLCEFLGDLLAQHLVRREAQP